MALFAVLANKPVPGLGAKIAELYSRDFYKINGSQWLVVADTTPRGLAEALGIRTGEYGRAVVLKIADTASGWHSKSLWDWVKQKAASD